VRLKYAPNGLPDAQRGTDIGLAVTFLTVVGSAFSAEFIEPLVLHHAANEATTVLMVVAGGLAFDRFASAGDLWNMVTSGLDRLMTDDPAREARVDAACFLIAYLLGLPFAPFRPDVQQVLNVHASLRPLTRPLSSSRRKSAADTELSIPQRDVPVSKNRLERGVVPPLDDKVIDLYLVWLLAGVAAESMMDGILVESDAARARTLLRKVTGRADESRLVTAYAVGRRLLTRHQVVHAKLAENMLSGLSAGECITLLDREFARDS
jgi:hypothetical protein